MNTFITLHTILHHSIKTRSNKFNKSFKFIIMLQKQPIVPNTGISKFLLLGLTSVGPILLFHFI